MTDRVVDFAEGIGQATAERTICRKKEDGSWETWADVCDRVSKGNVSLLGRWSDLKGLDLKSEIKSEQKQMTRLMKSGMLTMSGRHLQHGDETQSDRTMEVMTNCSTSITSFVSFYLLMSGSGVGRSFDDRLMVVDWNNAPNLRVVLDESHPDFDWSAHKSVREAKHKYTGKDVLWWTVGDSREGWTQALEVWENAAFEKIHKDKLLVLDFSQVRCKGSPIGGMQDRPASGPVPLMNAFMKASSIKGAGLARFVQAMYLDHYFAECVLVGGARRSARMSTKIWTDPTVIDFIRIKRPLEFNDGKSWSEVVELRDDRAHQGLPAFGGCLWSSNNSIMVDEEFWTLLRLSKKHKNYKSEKATHARKVFKIATECAYGDGTGEPGFINVDKLVFNNEGIDKVLNNGEFLSDAKYKVRDETALYLKKLAKLAQTSKYTQITNPCVPDDTWVQTLEGPRQVKDLIGTEFCAVVDGRYYESTEQGFFESGEKEVFRVNTFGGSWFEATENHKVLTKEGKVQTWKELKDCKIGDLLVLQNQKHNTWEGEGNFAEGWLVGSLVGDGNFTTKTAELKYWGEDRDVVFDKAVEMLKDNLKSRFDCGSASEDTVNTQKYDYKRFGSLELKRLAETCITLEKNFLPCLEQKSSNFCKGFLQGWFDADGSVMGDQKKGVSIRLSSAKRDNLVVAQRMLLRLGIESTIYDDRKKAGLEMMPDGKGGQKEYMRQALHEVVISKESLRKYADIIGFLTPYKQKKLFELLDSFKRKLNKDKFTTKITSIESVGVKKVYDCSIPNKNCFDGNGFHLHNCGEISLSFFSGFCVIGDVNLNFALSVDEAEQAVRMATRALIRTNTMPSIYAKEVERTNRIGVGLIGVHEYAWKQFGFGFRDLIDEKKSQPFWDSLARLANAVTDEAETYSKKLGLNVPHTMRTVKPAGTVSKLSGVTEGWHLPAKAWYLRWVQFRNDDPLVKKYRDFGYPTRDLVTYTGTTIVGFPTSPIISTLGLGDKLVTASEATMEEQYQWVRLGEKYWLRAGDESKPDDSNQISYTLKFDPKTVTYKEFRQMLLKNQPTVKCCSVMPSENAISYEYVPEQIVSKAEYEGYLAQIKKTNITEDIGREHLECAGGACPIDVKEGSK